ncbi:DUF885 family protein [Arenicella xantha]|uniref:Uncharacterized protein (DUF885 family) n=1 Tax=Arenicella xantha TaxID=644221 RepID=A0A395JPJ2_9GAMM|nr:DUF885 family protein [Arenicella xantha]RBP53570.1 uncharacterized protein (DUF885 family) [Arenicella xantha]
MNKTHQPLCRTLRSGLLCLVLIFSFTTANSSTSVPANASGQNLVDSYIEAWTEFYPSSAFAYGDVSSATSFETFTELSKNQWLAFNKMTVSQTQALLDTDSINQSLRIDLQILLAQAENELADWSEDQPLTEQPQWYAEQISQALTSLLIRDQLPAQQRSAALVARLIGIQQLCDTGIQQLSGGNALRTETAIRTLKGTREFYAGNLRTLTADWPQASNTPDDADSIGNNIDLTVNAIERLEGHLRDKILPKAGSSAAIGVAHYTAKLARRTSGKYTPSVLLAEAGKEMQDVRALMTLQAQRWLKSLPNNSLKTVTISGSPEQILAAAIDAMEQDREDNSADFLASFRTLTYAAERFVEQHQLATIPKPTTLTIALSPTHFSGAAVGGVYPTGPFSPQADTIFYVPSVSDSAPIEAKDGFYRSFNTHFNTMIMSHEMFPGHYLQYKVAVTQAPAVRSLFANGSYVEGWGSFSEELMLDAGWADDAPLTRLAHLRKRLENATRAYVSVQVNTAQWGESQVLSFARDEGLLAPQFAKNLWQRVVNSPMQITDYFTGAQQFRRLFVEHKASSPDAQTKPWVDAVLQAGPVPPVMLEPLL